MFYRPRYQKADQDVGFFLGWEGDDLAEVRLSYTFERFLNNTINRKGSLLQEARYGPSALHRTPRARTENRLYFSVDFRWRDLTLVLRETIELDRESYRSFAMHDKTFVQAMATF